jgi:flagellar motor switch protein FliN/FliY
MEIDRQTVQDWCFRQLAQRLAEVFEAMSGARPEVQAALIPEPAAGPATGGLLWRQSFTGAPGAGAGGAAWIQASEKDWVEASNRILRAAGIEEADEPTLRSTWTETLGQALSSLAADFSGRLGREVTCAAGEESSERGPSQWIRLSIQFAGESTPTAEITGAFDDGLLESLSAKPEFKTAAAASGTESSGTAAAGAISAGAALSGATPAGTLPSGVTSKTFDLLLDVELPVSVSFGRAQVPLKDVIKLTTGAIVELNRSITEPVEVIVNNCVIARGEVVVVEGNFGVRIREVISRQDRLRTLN